MNSKKKYIKEYYDKNAEKWTSKKTDSFHHELPFRKFEKLLKKGNRVLDIGCAYGIHVPLFLGIGRKLKYEGIDISKSMIKIAKSRYPQLPFSVADIAGYKPKKKFDAFWASAILMHIPEDERDEVLSSLEHILKPGAVGYLTLPVIRPNPENENDQRHFTLYSKDEFSKLAKSRKWKILSSGNLEGSAGNLTWNWFLIKI